jgi:hypothetical protein
MEWTQIAAWVAWAWVWFMTFFSVTIVLALFTVEDGDSGRTMAAVVTAACALNAILGLMLIQTLGLTV